MSNFKIEYQPTERIFEYSVPALVNSLRLILEFYTQIISSFCGFMTVTKGIKITPLITMICEITTFS